MPNQLILPPIPNRSALSDCGPCSGTNKYNMQLDGNCDFTGSRPINPPGDNFWNQLPNPQPGYTPDTGYLYDQPTPVSRTTEKSVGPSTIPQIVGQFFDKYLNPDNKIPPNQSQTGTRPFGKPCPRDRVITHTRQPDVIPKPDERLIQRLTHQDNPCDIWQPTTWNNTESKRLPLQTMCASGNMRCFDKPFPAQFTQPTYIPKLLDSGKLRDSTTPDDLCVPNGSTEVVNEQYQQYYTTPKIGYIIPGPANPTNERPPNNGGFQGVFNPF